MEIVNLCGAVIELDQLQARRTYSGLLAGTRLRLTHQLLEEIPSAWIPAEWGRRYPVIRLGLRTYLENREIELPDVMCAGLLVSIRDRVAGDRVAVGVWFQNGMFESPPEEVLNELRTCDWRRNSSPTDYYG